MGKILEYIQGDGAKFQCFKTKKMSLDATDNDIIEYSADDNPVVQTTKSVFAETDRRRQSVVDLRNLLNGSATSPIFRYFLDGSRHTVDEEQLLVAQLCKDNRLNDKFYRINFVTLRLE